MRFSKALLAILILLAFTFVGCGMFGGEEKVDEQKLKERLEQIKKSSGQDRHTEIKKMAEAQEVLDEVGITYQYDPINKQDPFRPYAPPSQGILDPGDNPLLKYEVRYFKLVGIVRSSDRNAAIFEDPSGRAYTVHVGDLIGKNGGSVRAILDDAVIVEETRLSPTGEGTETIEMTIRLRPEQME